MEPEKPVQQPVTQTPQQAPQPPSQQLPQTPLTPLPQQPQPSVSQIPTVNDKGFPNKFSQFKLLGGILALIAVIFIILVIAAIISNFVGSKRTKTEISTSENTLPKTQTPTPAPTIPASRFNITP